MTEKLNLEAIEARCEALDGRMGQTAWTLGGPDHYGLFSVYDGDGIVIYYGVKEQQDFIAHARADVPALVAEVERLRRELYDEQVRRDEWKRMYDQAIAGTEAERLRAMIGEQRYYTAETTEAIAAERDAMRASLEAVLEEAESDFDRDIILTECRSALAEPEEAT